MPLLLLIAGTLAALAAVAAAIVLAISAFAARSVIRPDRSWRPEDWAGPEGPLPGATPVHVVNSAGLRLAGWLIPPPPGRPVVIVSHGFGTNHYEGQDMVPWLTGAGYGVFLFDFQGHGESEGQVTTVGLREVDDYLCAVRFLRERLGPDVPLLAVGLSMGAAVAIMAAARCPDVLAVVADSPFATLHRAVARSFELFLRLPPRLFSRPTLWFAERFTGGKVSEVRPIDAVGAIAPRPLLIVQGTEDAIVNPEDSRLLYGAAGEPRRLWRLEGCGHVAVRAAHPDEYRQRVLALLAEAVPPEVSTSQVSGLTSHVERGGS
jgi:alpha-beta hydrolase superfamily lysophospholipase